MAGESVLDCRGLRRRFGEIVAVDGVGFGRSVSMIKHES